MICSSEPFFGVEYCFCWVFSEPGCPPTEGAVGDDEVLALGHQPQIGIGVFIALVVCHQGDAAIGQRDAGAGGFGLVRKDEVMRGGRKALQCPQAGSAARPLWGENCDSST